MQYNLTFPFGSHGNCESEVRTGSTVSYTSSVDWELVTELDCLGFISFSNQLPRKPEST